MKKQDLEMMLKSLCKFFAWSTIEDDPNADMLLATYEVELGGEQLLVGVCISNPFLYAVDTTQEKVIRKLKKVIKAFYKSIGKPLPGPFDNIRIPTHLPKDF